MNRPDADSPYNAACFGLRHLWRSGEDSRGLTLTERAMRRLTLACAAGYKDAWAMKQDTDLDPLREREDFKKLLADLEKANPVKPMESKK